MKNTEVDGVCVISTDPKGITVRADGSRIIATNVGFVGGSPEIKAATCPR
jgi:hypothetical protein